MHSEYHKWYSPRLGREMELKVYGHYAYKVTEDSSIGIQRTQATHRVRTGRD